MMAFMARGDYESKVRANVSHALYHLSSRPHNTDPTPQLCDLWLERGSIMEQISIWDNFSLSDVTGERDSADMLTDRRLPRLDRPRRSTWANAFGDRAFT